MSAGVYCAKPVLHRKNWVVTMRKSNRSAFNGYRITPSAYSQIRCLVCGCFWRTKAAYVSTLRDSTEQEKFQ